MTSGTGESHGLCIQKFTNFIKVKFYDLWFSLFVSVVMLILSCKLFVHLPLSKEQI